MFYIFLNLALELCHINDVYMETHAGHYVDTHTTSSAAAMDSIAELPTSPVQPWDALICTSHAVKSNVEVVIREQANYLSVD